MSRQKKHAVGESRGLPTSETQSPPLRDGLVPWRLLARLERGFESEVNGVCNKLTLVDD